MSERAREREGEKGNERVAVAKGHAAEGGRETVKKTDRGNLEKEARHCWTRKATGGEVFK